MNLKKKSEQKKGQVTIFIILGIILVVILIILLNPNIRKNIPFFSTLTPEEMISKECLAKNIMPIINETMLRGGNLNPELYFRYDNLSINYLCYTSQWYRTCVMQIPLLKQEIESQIESASQDKVDKCLQDLEKKLKAKGYDIKVNGTKKLDVNIRPKEIVLSLDLSMTTEKGEETRTYDNNNFRYKLKSQAYDMIMIASSIQNFEARFGDSITETYMGYYPNIKLEKLKQADGTKIYIITERNTGEKMQFATRSLAWPPGYAL